MQWSRASPLLEVSLSLTAKHIVAAFEGAVPTVVPHAPSPFDHGTEEFTSKAVEAWAFYRSGELAFTRLGTPTDNGHIGSFIGRERDECLNVHQFLLLAHAKTLIEAWRQDYNAHRPHSSLAA